MLSRALNLRFRRRSGSRKPGTPPMVEKTNSLTRRHSNVATELKVGGADGLHAPWRASCEGWGVPASKLSARMRCILPPSRSPTLPSPLQPSRLSSFWTRTVSTVILIGVFLGVIAAGHVPLMFMILGIQAMMVRELFALARVSQQENKLPGFRAQQWYFFGVATLWVYIRFIIHNLSVELSGHARAAHLLGWVIKHHTILCFSLYTAGFVSFVLTLKKGMYTYQFQQYGWTHMILLVIILPSSFFVSNIFDGLIWFLLPTLLVITNDIVAYLAGFFFGRTPLIKLSPKKTWEGFIGGLLGAWRSVEMHNARKAAQSAPVCRVSLALSPPLTPCRNGDTVLVPGKVHVPMVLVHLPSLGTRPGVRTQESALLNRPHLPLNQSHASPPLPPQDLSIIQDLSCNDMPPIYTPQTYYASNVLVREHCSSVLGRCLI